MIEIPGEVRRREWGIVIGIRLIGKRRRGHLGQYPSEGDAALQAGAVLRAWRPGDRVRLRHSGSARKVKEVLERMHITGSARANWPVLELDGRILWMQGVQLEPEPGIEVSVSPVRPGRSGSAERGVGRAGRKPPILTGIPCRVYTRAGKLRSTIEATAHPGGRDSCLLPETFALSVT